MTRLDRLVLAGLQVLIVGVPLLLGGMLDTTVTLVMPLVLALLGVTVWRRWRDPSASRLPLVPGVAALAAFVLLGLATTVPLPPALLRVLAPASARLYELALPGWPSDGAWSVWRSVAIERYAVWIELLRFGIGFGAFAVVVAYPWAETSRGEDGRAHAFRMLFLTLVGVTLLNALLAFAQEAAGNGQVMWIWLADASASRLSGPFVNPNHLALWLEMVIPAVIAWALLVFARMGDRLRAAAHSGRAVGVQSKRAWAAALIANQGRLWAPLAAAALAVTLLAAHLGTDSRGGRAALAAGLVVAALGFACRALPAHLGVRLRRHAPLFVGGILLVTMASFVVLARSGDEDGPAVTDEVDVSLGSRLAVASAGMSVVAEHPIFGSGLGTWLHAFRPHQAPPVDGGIWDHAHNDYLELGAETGIAGIALTGLFAFAIARALRRRSSSDADGERPRRRRRHGGDADLFEGGDWQEAFRDPALLRWGLVAGVVAVLVHSFVDFGLRIPANLLALMIVLGLLVLTARPRPASGPSRAPAALLAVLVLAAMGPVRNALRGFTGEAPLSAQDALDESDALHAEEDDQAGAVALARRAIDLSPGNRETHEMLAEVLGPGEEGDAGMRVSIALEPWAITTRDSLGLRLWERGEKAAAAQELEQAIFMAPYLRGHAWLDPESEVFPSVSTDQLRRELVEGETMSARLGLLEPEMANAIEHGLRRALESQTGSVLSDVTENLVTFLEARGRWSEAADTLRTQGEQRLDDTEALARAARNYLKADALDAAERTLLTALTRKPEEGTLYRKLAVDVYARRGDFDTADTILAAGERNATDLAPVYRGVTDVLERRETSHPDLPLITTPPPVSESEGDAED